MTLQLTRRGTLKMGCSLGGATLFGRSRLAFAKSEKEEPHFFISLLAEGGLDCSYLFDARPRSMTAAGIIQNYNEDDSRLWTGSKGGQLLAGPSSVALEPYKNDFSVINGVIMSPGFDGHDQNLNYLYTGSPFGGESFVPHLNTRGLPLDYIVDADRFQIDATNSAGGIPLGRASLESMREKIRSYPRLNQKSHLFQHLRGRATANGARENSRFATGSRMMSESLGQVPKIAKQIASIELPPRPTTSRAGRVDLSQLNDSLELASASFRSGIAESVIIELRLENIDAHDQQTAKKLPEIAENVSAQIARVLEFLKSTPYNAQKSLFEVTTVLFASEFSRTMRQSGKAIDQTGTDHNPLNNSVIVAGKGIAGGRIIGSSDLSSENEVASKAHLLFDPECVKIMGRPFDFASEVSIFDDKRDFHIKNYLTFASVANTLLDVFGVSEKHHFLLERNGDRAKVLRSLRA